MTERARHRSEVAAVRRSPAPEDPVLVGARKLRKPPARFCVMLTPIKPGRWWRYPWKFGKYGTLTGAQNAMKAVGRGWYATHFDAELYGWIAGAWRKIDDET